MAGSKRAGSRAGSGYSRGTEIAPGKVYAPRSRGGPIPNQSQPPKFGPVRQETAHRSSRRPVLPCLLVTRDPSLLRSVRLVTQREEVTLDSSGDVLAAMAAMTVKHYQAVLVDGDLPETGRLLRSIRGKKEKPVAVALVASGAFLSEAFLAGATLAIHKPVAVESLRLALRAAYSVGNRQGRKAARRSGNIACRLGLPGSRLLPGSMLDVGEGGACVAADRCMPPGTFVTLRFALPGADSVYDVGAVAVWNDGERRTGLRFQRLHYRHAGRIRNWVLGSAGQGRHAAAS